MTATVVSASIKSDHAQPVASESRVDRDSHFNGLYETKQNLRVEGIAEGEIECAGTVVVAEGARVKAKITANTTIVAGELEGEITCRDVFEIMPSGRVQATVSARRLIVQEGGFYNGEFHMIANGAEHAANGSSSRPLPADLAEPADTGVLTTDEWWSKMTAPASTGSNGGNGKKQKSN